MAFLVRAMATQPMAALPNDKKTLSALHSANVPCLSRDVARRALEAACKVEKESDKKAKAVKRGLQLWIPTMSLFLLSVLLMVTLGQLWTPVTAESKIRPSTELPTVTENRQRNDDTNDQNTNGNEPNKATDQGTKDGNVLGPNRVVLENLESPVRGETDDDDR